MRRPMAALTAATILALSGCSPTAGTNPVPAATAIMVRPTEAVSAAPVLPAASAPLTASPTVSSPPVASPGAAPAPSEPVGGASSDGGTYPGPFFLGRADAPVTIDEYADFQ